MITAKDILTKKYLKIGLDDTISQMIGKMKRAKKNYALVFDGKKYLGMMGSKFLITSRIDPSVMKVKNVMKKRSKSKTPFFVPVLSVDTSIKDIARLLSTADAHALPVMQHEQIIGVVESPAVAVAVANEYKKVKCEEIASMNIKTAVYKDQIGKLIEEMHNNHIKHVPVVDEKGKLVGIVSAGNLIDEFHLWKAFISMRLPGDATHEQGKRKGYGLRDKIHTLRIPVEQIMTDIVFTKKLTATVSTAIKQMVGNDVDSIVLTKNNEPVGILTYKDVFLDYEK